jgi:hypothetical protein
VAQHPLLLLEAVDVIGALRAELDRERRWVSVLERAMIHNLKAGHDSKDREKREE